MPALQNIDFDPISGWIKGPDFIAQLSPARSRIFEVLWKSAPRVVTREKFYDELYGLDPNGGPESKTLDVHICQLRKVLSHSGIEIATIWGSGWYLRSKIPFAKKITFQSQLERARAS